MTETNVYKSKKSFFPIALLVAVTLIAGLVYVVRQYYTNLNAQLFLERREHLVELTEKASQIIVKANENALEELNSCAYVLEHEELQPDVDISRVLAYMGEMVGDENTIILLFDKKGNYYSSDGASGYWQESDFLQSAPEKGSGSIEVMQCPHETDITRMIYLRRLQQEIVISEDGNMITHVAVAVNGEKFKGELSVTGFGERCYTFLTNSRGRRIYQYEYNNNNNNNEFLSGYNLINAISACPVVYEGTYEGIKEALDARASDAFEFTYSDEKTGEKTDWFVGISYVEDADWVVLMLVPGDVLGAGTAALFKDTLLFFASVAGTVILIFVMLILAFVRSQADRRLLDQQEKNNLKLKAAAEEAESASRAKTEFLSHMSHDIRTPINAIMGMTGIAIKNIGNQEKVADCLGKIDGSSQHLLSLVNDVLDMSRIESGKTVMNSEVFSLKECLNNCASIISGQLVNRDIALIRDFEGIDAPAVLGDELHLRQVFINILGNSVKFTPDGGSITFRAFEEEVTEGKTTFVFELSDTGIGMSEAFLPKLFEAFSQEDGGSRTTYKGTGLGMAITKRFVDLMGGSIVVESKLNKGTKFTLRIPMEIREIREEAADTAESYEVLKGKKVLLAEDNELNAEIALEMLEDVGITAERAVDGAEAVRFFRESKIGEYAAILMDIMMPEMNGYEAAMAIRRLGRSDAPDIPIIALTANAYDEDIKKAKAAGMNAHVAKPVNPAELLKTLAHCVLKEDEQTEVSLDGLSVLTAEDNELNAEIILDTLEEYGMKVMLVSNGKEALDAFSESKPGEYQLILMDMQMPVMDGVTAASRIRNLPREDAKTVPILAMTANSVSEAGSAAAEAGMSGFLMKPLRAEDIQKYFADQKRRRP